MPARFLLAILVAACLAAPALHAQQAPAAPTTEGEVRRIDKAAGTVTLKHGAIRNLDMQAMTMTFGVKDRAMLDGLKVGDRVRFTADQVGGSLTLTGIKVAN